VSELAGNAPAFNPDGELVATVDGEQVRVWRAGDGQPAHVLAGDAFVFSPDGRSILVRQAGEWRMWDTTTWEERYRLPDYGESGYGEPDYGEPPFFSADGGTIVMQEGYAGSVRLYAAETGTQLLKLPDITSPLAISPDGSLLAFAQMQEGGASDYQAIALWETASGRERQVLGAEIQTHMPLAGIRGHYSIDGIAFSPDGRLLLSAGPDAIRVWDVASGQHLRCYQTPANGGAAAAFWGADAAGIAGRVNGDIYFWEPNSNHPVGLLGLNREPEAGPFALTPGAFATQSGRLLSQGGFQGPGRGDSKVYLWDISSRRLLGVLPPPGDLEEAVLSPAGERAVTVAAYYPSYDDPEEWPYEEESLLWDTNHGSVALAAAAQQSYWDALAAAANGEPPADQLRLLRKAQALSPELFGAVEQLDDAHELGAYKEYLARLGQVEVLADAAGPAAASFYAELRDARPKWTEWPTAGKIKQARQYIHYWEAGDPAGLMAAYREFAAIAPDAALAPEVHYALLGALAPEVAARARAGDVAAATVGLAAALSRYPELDVEPESAAQHFYAQALVDAGRNAVWEEDIRGALASFEEALAFDPALQGSPPDYVQVFCALGPDAVGAENAATICTEFGGEAAPIVPGENVTGSLEAGAVDFWRFDAPGAMTITLDVAAGNGELYPRLDVIGPDGAAISESIGYSIGGDLHVEERLPAAGRYLVGVSGYQESSGGYELTLAGTEVERSDP
jgi:hypothetical protein